MDDGKDITRPASQLGLFGKLPVAGTVKTRLSPPLTPEEASRLYAAFLEDMSRLRTWLAPIETTLFLVQSGEGEARRRPLPDWRHAWQRGGDLGARLENAFADLHARGSPVVLVGSDHPDLPVEYIHRAFELLKDSDVVLGPTPDGGYHLIGTRENRAGLLAEVEWSTSRTAAQTEHRITELGLEIAVGRPWPDVDTWEDVLELRQRLVRDPSAAPATARVLDSIVRE